MQFGKYKPIDIRKIREKEDKKFTPWLKENIQYLNECLNTVMFKHLILKPGGIKFKEKF